MTEPARRPSASASPVAVHVERLVLDGLGLTRTQGAVVQRAFERELTRLFTRSAGVTPWNGGGVPSIPAASVRVDGAPRPAQLGRDVARSIFSSLRNSP